MAEAVRHPRAFRPYRVTLYVLFIGFAVVSGGLFLASIVRNLSMAPSGVPGVGHAHPVFVAGKPLSEKGYLVCLDRLVDLHHQLGDRFDGVARLAGKKGSAALDAWQDFSKTWHARLDQTAGDCGIGEGTGTRSDRLSTLYDRLIDLHRVYSTEATRLLREDGDTVKAAEDAFRAAQRRAR